MKPGDKVVYNGIKEFWCINSVNNARSYLVVGHNYTIKEIKTAYRRTLVKLQETGNVNYSADWFTKAI
jgi:hypothetical protein